MGRMRMLDRERPRHTAAMEEPEKEGLRRPVVVVIEDDDELRALISSELAKDRYEIVAVADGTAALQELDRLRSAGCWDARLAMIVSDVRLPDFSGMEILDCVRILDDSVPVIMITAFGDPQLHASARQLGASRVIDKPFDLDAFRMAVRAEARQ